MLPPDSFRDKPAVLARQPDSRFVKKEKRQLVSIFALLASVFLLVAGTNLQGVLLPIHRQLESASIQQVGLLSSGWSFGFMLACVIIGPLVTAIGHVRSFSGLAAMSAAATMLFLPIDENLTWIVLRIITGFCFGGLSIVIEGWLNEYSDNEQRGRIFAAYMTVSLLASLAGTLSLAFLDPMQDLPYILMGIAVVLSIVPVALTPAPVPRPVAPFSIKIWALYRMSPTGVFGCFAVGLISGALGGLLPAYGLSMGLSTHAIAILLAAAPIGGALAYYPAGVVSDRIDRRIVIIALTCTGGAICAMLTLYRSLPFYGILLAVGAFGFCQYPLYGVCVTQANDRVREQSFSQVASELLIVFGGGTVLGPPLAVSLMYYGARFLFLFIAIVLLILSGFAVLRVLRRPYIPESLKTKTHPLETAPNSMHVFRPQQNSSYKARI